MKVAQHELVPSDKYTKSDRAFSGVRSKFDFKVRTYWKFALVFQQIFSGYILMLG